VSGCPLWAVHTHLSPLWVGSGHMQCTSSSPRAEHISGSPVFHVSNDTQDLTVHRISFVRLDRVMEAYDGDRAFYGPQCGGVCRTHRRARADLFGPRTCNNEPDTF